MAGRPAPADGGRLHRCRVPGCGSVPIPVSERSGTGARVLRRLGSTTRSCLGCAPSGSYPHFIGPCRRGAQHVGHGGRDAGRPRTCNQPVRGDRGPDAQAGVFQPQGHYLDRRGRPPPAGEPRQVRWISRTGPYWAMSGIQVAISAMPVPAQPWLSAMVRNHRRRQRRRASGGRPARLGGDDATSRKREAGVTTGPRTPFQAMNLAIARYWQAAAAQTQAWKTSW
jgi:hypothetical protein